jgi:RND family efflux transporter MFP subunit
MGSKLVRNAAMKYRIIILILVMTTALLGCTQENDETSQPKEKPSVVVQTESVEQVDFPVTVRIGGTFHGDRQTVIPAKVQTTIADIPVRRGQSVHAGETLVLLDPGGVQSQYNQAQAIYQNAEKQFDKMKTLYEAGAISETQLDGSETEYKVARANYDAARQTVRIDAPFSGVITDIYVREGDEVSPGIPMLELADISTLRLLLEVPTSQIGLLAIGQTVRVNSPQDESILMIGSITGIADAAGTQTRSFEVECNFPSPSRGFTPGMYVLAEIETKTLHSAIVVPNDAILYRSGEALIYVVDSDTAVLMPVEVLASADGRSAINCDLNPGRRVVVVGQKNLTPGTSVREANL